MDVHVVALVVGLVRAHSNRLRERQHAVLRRPGELATGLDHLTVAEGMVEHAPADAVTCLEHDDRVAGLHEVARRGQAGQASTDDRDVGLDVRGTERGGPRKRGGCRAEGSRAQQLPASQPGVRIHGGAS